MICIKIGDFFFTEKGMYSTPKAHTMPQAVSLYNSSGSKSSLNPIKGNHRILVSARKAKLLKEIRFYDTYGKYGEFTNFYPCLTLIDGATWRTTEHYFQAQKFIGTPYVEYIKSLKTAREVFQFSREQRVKQWIRCDWHRVKEGVMKKALLHKFSQNKRLQKLLLDTGDNILVEHTENDSYWGDGGDGSGKNRLGILLMEVRGTLRTQAQAQVSALSSRSPSIKRSNSTTQLSDLSSNCAKCKSTGESKDKLPQIEPRKSLLEQFRRRRPT